MRNIRSEKIIVKEGLRVDLPNRNDVTMVLLTHHVHLANAIGSVDHHPCLIADDATNLLLGPQRC